MKKIMMAALAAAMAIALMLTGCRGGVKAKWHTASGAVWNTTYNVTWQGHVSLADSLQAVFAQVDSSLSVFNRCSLVSRINRCETNVVDSFFAQVFNISQQVASLSDGRFDPTVSPLVELWGFGTDRSRKALCGIPSAEEIDSAIMLVGISDCQLDFPVITKKAPGTTFNFSAVAKGYCCDLIGDMLRRNGVENYMVEVGGEIAVSGVNNRQQPWRLQIDAPEDSVEHRALTAFSITDCGVATSGNYRNYRKLGDEGRRVGHTINPITGMPAETDVLSATVIAPTCALADAWATACMALGATDAMRCVESDEALQCLLVVARGDSLQVLRSSDFPNAI